MANDKENKDWFAINDYNLYLRGPVTDEKTDELIRHILICNSELQDEIKHINMFIDSPGGDLQAAFGLIAVMRASTIPINTIAIGGCASAALMIAMAGDHRFVDKYCSIMSHTFSTMNGAMNKPAEINNWLRSVDLTKRMMTDHYMDCTGLPEAKVLAKLLPETEDVYLTAKEALELNLFDDIYVTFKDVVIEQDESPSSV